MISKKTYRLYLIVMALLFVLPILQRNIGIWHFKPLKGSYTSQAKPKIILSTWLDGSYQKKTDRYCTDSFGFRAPLVRMANQIDFSVFGQANARYVIVGKNNSLYETPYIEAHLGMDYLGDSLIQDKVFKLSKVKDTLSKLGVDLQIVFAPGKGSYYPEYIPDYYWKYRTDSMNYEQFKKHLDKVEYDYLDLHQWFRNMKDTAQYPLLTMSGIHWSKTGMVRAVDSILSYWNSQHGDSLPQLVSTFGMMSNEPQNTDADVEDGLNLMYSLPHREMRYPTHRFIHEDKYKLKTAVIADSYYWGLFDIGLSTIASDSGEFWYYFKQVYPQHFENQLMIEDLDLQKAIESKDVIMLLQTDATLDRFGFGFVEAAYELYF